MSQKHIINANLERVLLNTDSIKNVTNEYLDWQKPDSEKAKYKVLTITLWADILLNLIALIPSFKDMSKSSIVFLVIILVGLFIYSIVCASKWYEAYRVNKGKSKPQLDKMLLEKAKENMRFTAIGRIVFRDNEKVKYLVDNSYFLPHSNMNPNASITDQHDILIGSLYDDFGIRKNDIISIKAVDDKVHHSIKPIHGTVNMNAFVFYDITIKEQYKDKYIHNNSKGKWLTIDEMKNNSKAMATNSDVIELLDSFPAPTDSFVNILGDIKIIWNITSKCSYNCAICATHDDDRKELDAGNKLKVLNSICTAKHLIKNVDFAGGDPLHIDESTNIIQSAIQQLGKDRVSITTTGKGISEISEIDTLSAVRHCEITIDAAHNSLNESESETSNAFSREENEYSKDNLDNIRLISNRADSLTVNVPIINDDLSEQEINTLIDRIKWIKQHAASVDMDVSLIRLMPVGKSALNIKKEQYEKYNPVDVAKALLFKLQDEKINCKLHCSLRILPCFGNDIKKNHCEMLEHKIGIDCAGNVFACAWGGYLHTNNPPTKNPLYLGNLTKVSLIDILENRSKTPQYMKIMPEIDNGNYRDYCSVVAYYFKKDIFTNFDPLAKI